MANYLIYNNITLYTYISLKFLPLYSGSRLIHLGIGFLEQNRFDKLLALPMMAILIDKIVAISVESLVRITYFLDMLFGNIQENLKKLYYFLLVIRNLQKLTFAKIFFNLFL